MGEPLGSRLGTTRADYKSLAGNELKIRNGSHRN